ncbi:chemotaxis protein CheW [Cohnella boryungensis]|uniref:Chemotaxis protein CheW n=1 Tax=Cohnella boryungensis TaxID=768479 RepID=A0ABV8S9I8_9BACL
MSHFIVIGLNAERYALSIEEIQEIIKVQPITAVPCDKSFVKGVINLRGKIVPVIGLGARFGVPEAPENSQARIVIVSTEEEDIGISVDSVEQVAVFEEIMPPATDNAAVANRGFLSGIGRLGGRLVSILDLKAVLGLRGELH